MTTIRIESINAAINRANSLIDYRIYDNIHKQYNFQKQTVLSDNSLTENEKTEACITLNKIYDRSKILHNDGTRRICENCKEECLATSYCELCVRNYLKSKFLNWTSGNNDIDNFIKKCQIETIRPSSIIEWIPYEKLQNIDYLTKGGFSEIYTAKWIVGSYDEWDSKECRLKRFGGQKVILKKLHNVENANQSWFDEAKSHFTISNKYNNVVKCFGLTQDPLNKNYMLVMDTMYSDLRNYLQKYHNQLTWKERFYIARKIISALRRIHDENAIHRDLHSGNILYSPKTNNWYISDLGFCGPANKPLESIYGSLPYLAPEVICGNKTTKASDVYSIAILMWEISSGQPPFINYEIDNNLAENIVNGIRPKIISDTPLEYMNLMVQCWDADPLKRPRIRNLQKRLREIDLSYQGIPYESFQLDTMGETSNTNTYRRLFTSKVYRFENFLEPKNATEVEQEEFYSKLHDFCIPDDLDDINKPNNQENDTLIESNNSEAM